MTNKNLFFKFISDRNTDIHIMTKMEEAACSMDMVDQIYTNIRVIALSRVFTDRKIYL